MTLIKAIPNGLIAALLLAVCTTLAADEVPSSERSRRAIASVELSLLSELRQKGLQYGSPVFIRIFKQSAELELWVKNDRQYELFKTYPICYFSGSLGPKTQQGDNQAPEGFYFVRPGSLNPWSTYHLSFNLGYPNAYERSKGYTGGALMVHGKCVSIGCYAMTDPYINEIYAMVHAAFKNGQPFFRVHAFPFRMDGEILRSYRDDPWYPFWQNLKQGYDHFNEHRIPPNVTARRGLYHFEMGS
jgi:murein L,D-transpeptidase YafK